MKEGVNRLMFLCSQLHVDDPIIGSDIVHGNFVNKTDNNIATANVTADQTYGLNPALYRTTLKINIFQNFVCKPLTGPGSQVSSLCHELSHFYRYGKNGIYGGMGTDDMPTTGGFAKAKAYIETANSLKRAGSQYVFKNAYNIERYFELQLTAEELEKVGEDND